MVPPLESSCALKALNLFRFLFWGWGDREKPGRFSLLLLPALKIGDKRVFVKKKDKK